MRLILLIDMDCFFAQIEERENPQFKGEPVVVGSDPKGGQGRGVVSTANYAARQYGIHSALPITKAYGLCPDAIFLPVNMPLYARVSQNIMELIKQYSSLWEIVSLDEAYLDISSEGSYKKALVLAQKLKNEILEKEKLTATVGIGPNKLIAKLAASQAKPDGLLAIKPERADAFLEPLDIQKLPGVGPKTASKIRAFSINTIKELKVITRDALKEMFGSIGESIYEKARGIDQSTVESEEIIKSIGREHTFETDTRDAETIFNVFEDIIKEVHQETFKNNFAFRTITVRCRYQGFETHTKGITLKQGSDGLAVLAKEAKKLLLKFIIASPKPIRLIGLRVSFN